MHLPEFHNRNFVSVGLTWGFGVYIFNEHACDFDADGSHFNIDLRDASIFIFLKNIFLLIFFF